jgi:hypothetical protein
LTSIQGTTIQLLCFLAAEFPVQFLTKRYGFKYILPTMMMLWGTVCESSLNRDLRHICLIGFSMVSGLDDKPYLILYYPSIHWSMRRRLHPRYDIVCNVFLQDQGACSSSRLLLVNSQRCKGYLGSVSCRYIGNAGYWRKARMVLAIFD